MQQRALEGPRARASYLAEVLGLCCPVTVLIFCLAKAVVNDDVDLVVDVVEDGDVDEDVGLRLGIAVAKPVHEGWQCQCMCGGYSVDARMLTHPRV